MSLVYANDFTLYGSHGSRAPMILINECHLAKQFSRPDSFQQSLFDLDINLPGFDQLHTVATLAFRE